MSSVFAKALRDQRRGIVGWGISVVVLVGLMAALWPTVRDMSDLDTLLEAYPEPLRELFNFDDLGTAAGFLNAELYSIILPGMFAVFAVGRGARMLAGEEEAGTLEPVLATPIGRTRVLTDKFCALVVAVLALAAILAASSVVAGRTMSMDIAIADQLAAATAMALIGILHGGIAVAAGAATGSRSTAVTVGATVGAASYLLHALAGFSSLLESTRVVSPFHHVLADGAIGASLGAPHLAVLFVAVLIPVASAVPFERRDIATG